VFRVSGVINVSQGIELNEPQSYVTVAGQTSPGGITLTGSSDFIGNYHTNFHDGIFRHIRFRGRGNYDNIAFSEAHHLIFDHVDFSGGTDETFDITSGHDITVQWSTISNSDSSGQNYGALIAYTPTANYSIHHNLMAHHSNRCLAHMHWAAGGAPAFSGLVVDYTNNVVYNCAFDAVMYNGSVDGASFNLINNYFKRGPNTPSNAFDFAMPGQIHVYKTGQIYEGGVVRDQNTLSSRVAAAPSITTYSTTDAYNRVLDRVGAFPRDPMNARTVAEVRNGTGSLGKLNDAFLTGAPTPPMDSDLDGMPDSWETARGLNPSNASDASGDRNGDGYTNIEEYINERADSLVVTP
jgi:hypothetical protein